MSNYPQGNWSLSTSHEVVPKLCKHCLTLMICNRQSMVLNCGPQLQIQLHQLHFPAASHNINNLKPWYK